MNFAILGGCIIRWLLCRFVLVPPVLPSCIIKRTYSAEGNKFAQSDAKSFAYKCVASRASEVKYRYT